MIPIKILLVEDEDPQIQIMQDTLAVYQHKNNLEINLVVKKTYEEALSAIDNSFDGAIVDLKLENNADEYKGNAIIQEITKYFRIPVVILSGTPSNSSFESEKIPVYTRGEVKLDVIFDSLVNTYDTGLTKIFGGRGKIEKIMGEIFWNNVTPQLESWRDYANNEQNTEEPLLRLVLTHLLEFMDNDTSTCYPEEMYIIPPISNSDHEPFIKTGSIVENIETEECHVVISPACDLAIHNGSYKTDTVHVCLIEKREHDMVKMARKHIQIKIHPEDDKEKIKAKEKKIERAKRILSSFPRNNFASYYHYLPSTCAFDGGLINFRKITHYDSDEFFKVFSPCFCQISAPFTKDIVARFSSYYARQGQPDFDFDILETELKDSL